MVLFLLLLVLPGQETLTLMSSMTATSTGSSSHVRYWCRQLFDNSDCEGYYATETYAERGADGLDGCESITTDIEMTRAIRNAESSVDSMPVAVD